MSLITGSQDSFIRTPYGDLLLHGDAPPVESGGGVMAVDVIDSSLNNFPVTVIGDAAYSTGNKKYGLGSVTFDGIDDYLSISITSDLQLGMQEFTFDYQCYLNTTNVNQRFFTNGTEGGGDGWIIETNGSGNVVVSMQTTTTYYSALLTSTSTLSIEIWQHIAITRSGNNFHLFIDGVLEDTTIVSEPITATLTDLYFGGVPTALVITKYLDGQLDEIRLRIGTAEWVSTFTALTSSYTISPTDTETKFLIHCDTDISDASNFNRAVIANNGAALDNIKLVFGTESLQFSGNTDSRIEIAHDNVFNIDGNDFTIDYRAYVNSLVGSDDVVISKRTDNTQYAPFVMYADGRVGMSTTGSGWDVFDPAIDTLNLSLDTWQHIAFAKTGNIVTGFVDGIPILVKNGLSIPQYELFPATLLVHSNTTNGDTVIVDSSSNNQTITEIGDVAHSTANSKFGTSSMIFNRTQRFTMTGPDFTFGSDDFTVDCQVRIDANSHMYFFAGNLDLSFMVGISNLDPSRIGLYLRGHPWPTNGSTTITSGQFYHIALIRNGDFIRVYLDGVKNIEVNVGPTYIMGINNTTPMDTLVIGGMHISNMAGHIDEVHVVKGTAVWTADFTPPAVAYGESSTDISLVSNSTPIRIGGEVAFGGAGINESNACIDEFRFINGTGAWATPFIPPDHSYLPATEIPPENGVPIVLPDVSSNISLLIHSNELNGSTVFSDSSTNSFTITGVGGISHSDVKSRFGFSSVAFNGTTQYLSIANGATFDFGTADFTIDFRAYFNQDNKPLISYGLNVTNGFNIYLNDNNEVVVDAALSTSGWTTILSGIETLPIKLWHHISISKEMDVFYLFVNGVLQATYETTESIVTATTPLIIGANVGTSTFYDGYMEEIRVVTNQAAWVNNFIPPEAYVTHNIGDTILDLDFEVVSSDSNKLYDASKFIHKTHVLNGAALDNIIFFEGSNSVRIQNSPQRVDIPVNTVLDFGSDDFVLDTLVYFDDVTSKQVMSYGTRDVDGWRLATNSSGKLIFLTKMENQATYQTILTSVNTMMVSQWYNIVIQRSDSNIRMFIDDVEESPFMTTSSFISGTRNFMIGLDETSVETGFNGRIDKVSITKGNLSAVYYLHEQSVSSTSWVVNHGLGYYPVTRVFIGTVEILPASIIQNNVNTTTITFDNPQIGNARFV